MKQPEIGNRVAELRLQKGITQEKLAELCEVSTRTIQRIESGEVDPRAFTINNLSEILEYDFRVNNNENDTFWLAALHLSSIFCIFIIPLLIWSFMKKKSSKINPCNCPKSKNRPIERSSLAELTIQENYMMMSAKKNSGKKN